MPANFDLYECIDRKRVGMKKQGPAETTLDATNTELNWRGVLSKNLIKCSHCKPIYKSRQCRSLSRNKTHFQLYLIEAREHFSPFEIPNEILVEFFLFHSESPLFSTGKWVSERKR